MEASSLSHCDHEEKEAIHSFQWVFSVCRVSWLISGKTERHGPCQLRLFSRSKRQCDSIENAILFSNLFSPEIYSDLRESRIKDLVDPCLCQVMLSASQKADFWLCPLHIAERIIRICCTETIPFIKDLFTNSSFLITSWSSHFPKLQNSSFGGQP